MHLGICRPLKRACNLGPTSKPPVKTGYDLTPAVAGKTSERRLSPAMAPRYPRRMNPVEEYIRDYLNLDRELIASDYEEFFRQMTPEVREAAFAEYESNPARKTFAEAVCLNTPFEL